MLRRGAGPVYFAYYTGDNAVQAWTANYTLAANITLKVPLFGLVLFVRLCLSINCCR